MKPPEVSIFRGSSFVVADLQGDIDTRSDEVLGFYVRDMRHVSRWTLTLDGRRLDALSTTIPSHRESKSLLVMPTDSVYQNPTLSVIRSRRLESPTQMREELLVTNSGIDEAVVEVGVQFGADFADIFEVKDKLPKQGALYHRVEADRVVLGYRRGDFQRETHIEAPGAHLSQAALSFPLRLPPGRSWTTTIDVRSIVLTRRSETRVSHLHGAGLEVDVGEWLRSAPLLETGSDSLRHTYTRSLTDLAALRLHPEVAPEGQTLPAAGLPWFMTVFGRDSLIASYQALPFVSELARTTLRTLAAYQATEVDDFRDAEPGKVLHEVRFGELTYFDERPQSPYYGSSDATPLFVILLDEYERWTGDTDLARELERPARAALTWLDRYGDRDGDGFVEYERRNAATGLENQCWKDSWNSIVHPDGSLASLPRATCELQGYAYDARVRGARLAREVWQDEELASSLEATAADLRARFDAAYWVEDGGFYALALDGDKRPVRTLASNMGHLLWSGLVPESRVDRVVAHLMGEALFTGWGVRSLASGQLAYNPIGYHVGTVWPHDSSIIAAGLTRYGRHAEAARIAEAMLEAAAHFLHRLPEVFAGYPRALTHAPMAYPTASSPQAWAAGAPLLLLRTILGMEPQGNQLRTDPHVPAALRPLALHGVRGRWGATDVVVE